MLKSLNVISFLLFFVVHLDSFSQDSTMFNVQNDLHGRTIMDEHSHKINYPKSAINSNQIVSGKETMTQHSNSCLLNNCSSSWSHLPIMGDYIGFESMKTMDFNNDGTLETYLSASAYPDYFWYELKYDTTTNEYHQSWASIGYTDTINYMAYHDLDYNGIYEIYVVLETGDILVYDADTKNLINTINTGVNEIQDLEFGDLDADGTIEMVYSTDSNLYILNTSSFNLISQSSYGTYDLIIGNVDMDASNEIVTESGYVLQFDGVNLTNQWNYYPLATDPGLVELSDIDADGMNEIIIALGSDTISVFDADIQQLKYNFLAYTNIQALLVQDINNDNIDEIIYAGQWGYIRCMNAQTHTQMWVVTNPTFGVTRMSIADFDNDGIAELMWGAGTNQWPDFLYVANYSNDSIEWMSTNIIGPFLAVDVADVDGDGALEIVTLSWASKSASMTSIGGSLSVFDANTKELEFISDDNYFNNVWSGMADLKINDIDNDGDMEIIVASGFSSDGQLWIIDGTTKIIQNSRIYQMYNLDYFYKLDIADLDNDGQKEIIVGGSQVSIINASSLHLDWSSSFIPSEIGNLKVANIDSDSNVEIVVCGDSSSVYVIDGITHQMSQTQGNNYSSFDISDMNHDGINDIVAGKQNGEIDIIDGTNLIVMSTIQASTANIEGILIQSIDTDTIPEIVFGSDGRLNFINTQGTISSTQQFGSYVGTDNAIKIIDINNDNIKEIFFGSTIGVHQLSTSCTQCISLSNIISKTDVSCGATNNGTIAVEAVGGQYPISYTWNTGITDSTLVNLSPGAYIITTTDNIGCTMVDTVTLDSAQLDVQFFTTNVSCDNSILGTASCNVNTGTPPFNILWSNGDSTQTVSNLTPGSYSVNINDINNCSANFQFDISLDSLLAVVWHNDANCGNNGIINLVILPSDSSTTVLWNNGSQSNMISGLVPGNYIYSATNNYGCTVSDTVQIINTGMPITVNVYNSTDDNALTTNGDGTANVNAYGGYPPYTILWNDPFQQTTPTVNNLYAGIYMVTYTDSHGCTAQDTVVIGLTNGIATNEQNEFSLGPNPSNGIYVLKYQLQGIKNAIFNVYDLTGRALKSEQLNPIESSIRIDLSAFSAGTYFYSLSLDGIQTKSERVMLVK
jgi:hypothetical protein